MKKKIGLAVSMLVLLVVLIVYMKMSLGKTNTFMSVEPEENFVGSPGKKFSVNITVTNAPYNNTYAWQFYLNWTDTRLNLTAPYVTEGGFLKQGLKQSGNPGNTSMIYNVYKDQDIEWVSVGCIVYSDNLTDPINFYPSGNGALATVHFIVLDIGNSTLDLNHTFLLDPNEIEIDHIPEDGFFRVLLGDINRDAIVSVKDIHRLGKTYDTTLDLECDLDNDGDVDRDDLVLLADNYGNKG